MDHGFELKSVEAPPLPFIMSMNGPLAPLLIGPKLHFHPNPFGCDSQLHGLDDPGRLDAPHVTLRFFVVHAFSAAFSYSPFLPRNTTAIPGGTKLIRD
jgi:hypothetical protein